MKRRIVCEVSWKCAEHPDRLMRCFRKAEYRATGIGNEGTKSFRVCDIHAEVVRPLVKLWMVGPLK